MNAERRVFTKFHREVCCWIDQWYGLTMEDIRKIEEETKRILVEVSGVLKCAVVYVDVQLTLGGYFSIVTYHLSMCLYYLWDQSIVTHRVFTHASVSIYSLGPLFSTYDCVVFQASAFTVWGHGFLGIVVVPARVAAVQYSKELLS